MIIISTHALFSRKGFYVRGTGSTIPNFLQEKEIPYVVIRHPIYGSGDIEIETFTGGKSILEKAKLLNSNLIIRSIQGFYYTYKIVSLYKANIQLFIGVDPLNALFGLIFRFFFSIHKVIYYTADYTEKRFKNPLINYIYHAIDRFVIYRSDEVWNVSKRIRKLRLKQGIKLQKNIFIPNAPSVKKIETIKAQKKKMYTMVVMTTLRDSMDFNLIFRALKRLDEKYPKARLVIFGSGDWEKEFGKLLDDLDIHNKVKFYNPVPYDKLIEIVKSCGLGIALYTEEFSWSYYADSMKIRDYLACGLPVVTNNITSTSEDILKYGAGEVIDLNEGDLYSAFCKIFKDRKTYDVYKKNALKLAQKNDIYKILETRFEKILGDCFS